MKAAVPAILALLVAIGVGVTYTSDTHYAKLFGTAGSPGLIHMLLPHSVSKDKLNSEWAGYEDKWNGDVTRDPSMVNKFYNLVTDFYEYGWGQSFHFAHTFKNESHEASILRHEHRLADAIKLKKGMKCLDVGSGVGGPARAIAKYSGGNVVGVTINAYQVEKSQQYAKDEGLQDQVQFVQGDFTQLKMFADNTFDAAYASEATCHSPQLIDVYKEVYRTLKPGGLFASYEWIVTPSYNASNKSQEKIINDIEFSNGLPDLRNYEQVMATASQLGFKLVSEEDLANDDVDTRPWYTRLKMGWFSHLLTYTVCRITEWFGVAAEGTSNVSAMLLTAAESLVAGGEQKIFTPMHLFVFRKPE